MGSKKPHSGVKGQTSDKEHGADQEPCNAPNCGVSENADTEPDSQPSAVAQSVARLKSASFKAARERERVPQPLFWSLFSAQLEEIKAQKRTRRLLSDIFGGSGE